MRQVIARALPVTRTFGPFVINQRKRADFSTRRSESYTKPLTRFKIDFSSIPSSSSGIGLLVETNNARLEGGMLYSSNLVASQPLFPLRLPINSAEEPNIKGVPLSLAVYKSSPCSRQIEVGNAGSFLDIYAVKVDDHAAMIAEGKDHAVI